MLSNERNRPSPRTVQAGTHTALRTGARVALRQLIERKSIRASCTWNRYVSDFKIFIRRPTPWSYRPVMVLSTIGRVPMCRHITCVKKNMSEANFTFLPSTWLSTRRCENVFWISKIRDALMMPRTWSTGIIQARWRPMDPIIRWM